LSRLQDRQLKIDHVKRAESSLSVAFMTAAAVCLAGRRRLVGGYVEHYNNVRLNSATGYITPKDMLAGRQQEIHAERDRKLETARQQRQSRHQLPSIVCNRQLNQRWD
jgi:predicted amidohydrolase